MENQMWKHLLQHRIALVGFEIQLPLKKYMEKSLITVGNIYIVRNQNCAIEEWLSVGLWKLCWQSQGENYHCQATGIQ